MKHDKLLIGGVTLIAVAAAILSFCIPSHKSIVVSVWAIGVPLWFWFEYVFLIKEDVKNDPIQFERVKYSQELAAKVWLAVSAVLGFFYMDWALH